MLGELLRFVSPCAMATRVSVPDLNVVAVEKKVLVFMAGLSGESQLKIHYSAWRAPAGIPSFKTGVLPAVRFYFLDIK